MCYQQPGILSTVFGAAGAVEHSGCYELNTCCHSCQLDPPTNKSVLVMTKVKCVSNIFIDKYQQRRYCTKSNKVRLI